MKLIGLFLTAGSLCLLSSCSLIQQQPQPTDSPNSEAATAAKDKKKNTKATAESSVQPTPEQMETAMELLRESHSTETDTHGDQTPESTISTMDSAPHATDGDSQSIQPEDEPEVIPGGLRMGRFAPPEEAISSDENDAPAPNSVELHGFRSPNLKGGKLPMNINGKINKPE